MKISGIISEYNPFHNGHLYQISKTRKNGATHIVSVMSGNYVQRGDISVIDKFKRARLAVNYGVDLVIELPVIYSLSTAETFSRGAVSILNSLGCVDSISFGSECGSIELLKKSAYASDYFSDSDELKELLKRGESYPSGLQKLCHEKFGGEISSVFSSPNNLLGIEYIKALDYFGSDIEPFTITRKNSMHDSEEVTDSFASASLIRKLIGNNSDYRSFVPENVLVELENAKKSGELHFIDNLEQAILYKLRSMAEADFKALPDVSQGLENRILNSVGEAVSFNELLFKIKTKRYPLSKIRRVLLCALLDIKKSDILKSSPYARILAMNERGCEILKKAKKTSAIPIGTSLLKLSKTGDNAKKLAEIESRATDIYNLSALKKKICKEDYSIKITKQ